MIGKMDFIKDKGFCTSKDSTKKIKIQVIVMHKK